MAKTARKVKADYRTVAKNRAVTRLTWNRKAGMDFVKTVERKSD